jgi:hypothetical protein
MMAWELCHLFKAGQVILGLSLERERKLFCIEDWQRRETHQRDLGRKRSRCRQAGEKSHEVISTNWEALTVNVQHGHHQTQSGRLCKARSHIYPPVARRPDILLVRGIKWC